MSKFTPIDDKVLVRRFDQPAVTAGGIVIPDNARGRGSTAQVLAVGPGRLARKTGARIPVACRVGDEVALRRWKGTEVKVDGEAATVIHEEDILAVIEP